MKREIFEVLMGIKAGVIRAIQNPRTENDSATESVDKSDIFVVEPDLQFVPLDDNPSKTPLAREKNIISPPQTRYFQIEDEKNPRKIAYTVSGDMYGENILICLPGLLETKASFSIIHAYFLRFTSCKVISIDFSGRGDSDFIKTNEHYKMSLYLSDISQLIQGVVLADENKNQRITILGTSMGGVLAMYLTQIFGKKIYGIILNDIALTVNWTSLYTLYKSMKNDLGFREVRELAKDLSVDEKAISDVQLPGHFDLAYQADVWGMNFHDSLEGFKGRVGLIYGVDSKICTKQRVEGAKSFLPHIQTLAVPNAGHPAPFNLLVCDFIQTAMGV